MSRSPACRAVLALALSCCAAVYAQGQGLQLRSPSEQRSKTGALPIVLDADRIEGVAGEDTTAQGNASLRQGNLSIRADSLTYHEASEDVEALGSVRLQRNGDTLSGPSLRYSIKDATGLFEKPDFTFTPRAKTGQPPVSARGQAETMELLGENQYRIKDGFFTSCKPGDDGWLVRADELELDFTRDVGTARGASVYFEGLRVIAAPSFDFSLNNQRKSGFLPPLIGATGKSGPEFGVPYYLNLAPNYDLTLTPRYMEKRGLQLAEQLRYLQNDYKGDFSAEVLPNDRAADRRRHDMNLVGSYNRDGSSFEFVDFSHPSQVNGKRSTFYPTLSLPLITPGSFLTPKVGVHYTYYSLYEIQLLPDPATLGSALGRYPIPGAIVPTIPAFPNSISRSLPIFSVDSGLIYERETNALGQGVIQTLEPRFYYVYIPFRDQNQIPLFDTAIADFNYAQIFSENMFSGGDRINDARQLTAAVTSRMLLPSSGQELLRGTFGQRYYFKDQRVTLTPSDSPRTYHASNWLAALSGRVSQHWTLEGASEYDQRDYRTERLTLAARYRPEGRQASNLSYRYLSGDITTTGPLKQVDLSAQWPIAGRWYGVGRFNYSLVDSRIVEGIGGLEYGADCWTSRILVQRFALTAGSSSSSVFLQLELNGFSRLGSNPLETLKRNIPGYQRINAPSPDRKPGDSFDFYD